MAKKSAGMDMMPQIGVWAFIVGLAASVLAPILAINIVLLLGIVGVIVGLLNIADKEIELFLVANIAFLVAANSLGSVLAGIFKNIQAGFVADVILDRTINDVAIPGIVSNLAIFIAPAAAIVAIKALYNVAKA